MASTINSEDEESLLVEKEPGEDRIVMLCDGVFAIAITLLFIDIKIPTGLSEDSFNGVLNGEFLSEALFYLITFVIIASYWMQHRRLMHELRRIDGRFLMLTFLFLAFVAFFPVTSGIIGEGYSGREG